MAKRANKPKAAARADKHALYQESVQGVEFELDFVDQVFRDVRGRAPRLLREDFCGTALSACTWVTRHRQNRAFGVDLDESVLGWGERNNLSSLGRAAARVQLINGNVLSVKTPPVDVCVAFNFSYWIFQQRAELKEYFQSVHARLADDGVLFLDTFGGYEAHRTQRERRKLEGFTYVWHQAEYNPVRAEMLCHIHFEFPDGSKLREAFSYRWRLWGAQETRDLLHEVGFSRTAVHVQAFDDDSGEPIDEFVETEVTEDHASWIGYIVAEK